MTFSASPTWETHKKHTRFEQSIPKPFGIAFALPLYILVVFFGCIQSPSLIAATFELEDSILDSSSHAGLEAETASQKGNEQTTRYGFTEKSDKSNSNEPVDIKENETSATASSNTLNASGASFDNPFQPANISNQTTLNASASTDIYRQTYNKIGTIVDEEALTDAALKLMDFNAKLNDLNESIEDQMEPALQRFLGDTGSDIVLDHKKPNRLDIKEQSLELDASGKTSAITSVEMPTGIMGFLFQLPRYLFNIKNLLILLVCILILSLILKALHFILNRMY